MVRGTKGSYRTSTSRRRATKQRNGIAGDTYLLGDLSDEEDETFERKLARLHREVAEVQASLEERRQEEEEEGKEVKGDEAEADSDDTADPVAQEKVTQLLEALSSVTMTQHKHKHNQGPETQFSRQIHQYQKASSDVAAQENPISDFKLPPPISAIPSAATRHQEQLQTLRNVSDLDSRLTSLEQILGVDFSLTSSSSTNNDSSSTALTANNSTALDLPQPILPTLSLLHEQITILTSTASKHIATQTLDLAGQRAQKLMTDLERFESDRRAARLSREREWERQHERERERQSYTNNYALASTDTSLATRLYNVRNEETQRLAAIAGGTSTGGGSAGSTGPADMSDADQVAKINALYTTLSTIDGLAPTLPLLLERLRSLNVVHANAADASQTLDALERQQADLAGALADWKVALERLEGSVGENEAASKGNAEVVESWVKDLEGRIARFSNSSSST